MEKLLSSAPSNSVKLTKMPHPHCASLHNEYNHVSILCKVIIAVCTLSGGLQDDNPLLAEIATFFVDRSSVDGLAGVLLREIPPHGPTFIKQEKTADTPWPDVALQAMRVWCVTAAVCHWRFY